MTGLCIGLGLNQPVVGGGGPAALLTNGDFGTGDLTGWSDDSIGATGTATVNGSNQLELVRVGGSDQGIISQTVAGLAAGDYQISWDAVSGIAARSGLNTSFTNDNPRTYTHAGGDLLVDMRCIVASGTAVIDNIVLVAV